MTRLLGRRLLHTVVVLLIVTFLSTVLIDLVPGDPAYVILGNTATPDAIAQIHHELGLDRSLLSQYGSWLDHVVHGDFGTSIRTRQGVAQAVAERLPVTAELAIFALVMALVLAVPLGIYAAYHDRGIAGFASNLGGSALISAPPFIMGVLLSFLFAVQFPYFPVSGWVPLAEDPVGNLNSAFLPALTLALTELPVFMRLVRADMLATLRENYILAATAKGLRPWRILLSHALRPSSFSLLTVAGVSLGRLIGGAVVVEVIFGLPGIGSLIVDSINSKDLTMVQGIVILIALVYVLINALIDVAYSYLDPRVRAAR